ncbi:plasmid pRiA4b ORF-3 family protein [Bacillus alkalicellulosilyticus]|uniref:plasmid pRiA4b ORF-3 family protein n=1 Tax=Alkalihalobacterium alkalicellulosilyticum TaxID=1912214 RepID=UPI001481E386|nr:plasmid pRiA4b ORF-3 family protein [Bacillus alkalicellulosilyticus]
MLIQCTKKLLDELKVKPNEKIEKDPLFSWHANILIMNRKKVLVFMNDLNRYVLVLYGLKAKDFQNLNQLIGQAIRETFTAESIEDSVIEKYLQLNSEVIITKTKDKTSVARLNKACEAALIREDFIETNAVIQPAMSMKASRMLFGNGKNSYVNPNEELYKTLEVLTDGPVIQSRAVEMTVTLNLDNHEVWRRLVVPVNFTFEQLHETLQEVFDWKNWHLHEFYVYQEIQHKNSKVVRLHSNKVPPVLHIVSHEEAFSYGNGTPMKLEKECKLSDYLPAKLQYNYDFGDGWEHTIIIEHEIEDFNGNYSVCLAGSGDAPPEDVGGEYGFERFLGIISDQTHPEFKNMTNWGEQQGYQKFDLETVNRRLKATFR